MCVALPGGSPLGHRSVPNASRSRVHYRDGVLAVAGSLPEGFEESSVSLDVVAVAQAQLGADGLHENQHFIEDSEAVPEHVWQCRVHRDHGQVDRW